MGITTDAFSDTRIVEKRGRLRTHRIRGGVPVAKLRLIVNRNSDARWATLFRGRHHVLLWVWTPKENRRRPLQPESDGRV